MCQSILLGEVSRKQKSWSLPRGRGTPVLSCLEKKGNSMRDGVLRAGPALCLETPDGEKGIEVSTEQT